MPRPHIKALPSIGGAFMWFVEALFPSSCYACGAAGSYLCRRCYPNLALFPEPHCPHCNVRVSFGELGRSCRIRLHAHRIFIVASYHDEALKKLIHDFKYRYAFALTEPLADLALWWFSSKSYTPLFSRVDMVVPVPSHKKRMRERGFHPASRIAQRIAHGLNLPFQEALAKPKATPAQAKIKNKKERLQNIEGAFIVPDKTLVYRKTILLVDDVITTGATLRECAATLREAGAKQVWVMVVAKD